MAVAQVYPDILLAAQLISLVPLFPLNTTELSHPLHQENDFICEMRKNENRNMEKNLCNSVFSEHPTRARK